ncbi:MAG: hypothetical protein ABI434_19625 [Burkholderiaceae bacterium]
MYSETAPSAANVDIELPLADAGRAVDSELTMATVAGRGGVAGGPFVPTLSQVAAYPRGTRLRRQRFLRTGS